MIKKNRAHKNNEHASMHIQVYYTYTEEIHGEIMFEVFTVRQAWRKKKKIRLYIRYKSFHRAFSLAADVFSIHCSTYLYNI